MLGGENRLLGQTFRINRVFAEQGLSLWKHLAISVCASFILTSCSLFDMQKDPAPLPAPKAKPELTKAEPVALEQDSEGGLNTAEVFKGSGRFTNEPVSKQITRLGKDTISLNLVNVDIREAVDLVIGETMKENYVIDPEVSGTITIRSARPLTSQQLIPTLESVLELNGAAVRQEGDIHKIVPLEEAGGSFAPPKPVNGSGGYGLYLFPVNYVSAEELAGVLNSIRKGTEGNLRMDKARNILMFNGSGQEAAELAELIATFDLDWLAGMSFALVPLTVTDPATVITELEEVFQLDKGPLSGVVRFVEIERLQAVLVISKQPEYVDRARLWIKRLDRGGKGEGRQLFVYQVENARAADLAGILSQVFGDSGGDSTDDAAPPVNDVSTVAPGLEETTLSSELGTTKKASSETTSTASASSISLSKGGSAVRIIPDEKNNSLVILATAIEFQMIETALKRLDVVPVQVLIEATIAEVTLTDELSYGLQWFLQDGDFSGTFSSLSTGAISQAFPGFSYFVNSTDVKVVLNALDQVTDVKVISSPQLMVLDNQTARLQVGDQVPIATQSSVSTTDSSSPIVNSIEFKDTGIILDVTPRVSGSGLVVLDVKQEVSDVVSTTTSSIDSPTIQQRQIESSVAVTDGQTIALGGLIKDQETEGSTGLPILGDIPLLGNLFKTSSDRTVRTELLVLITPRVVRSSEDARKVTDELRSRLKKLGPLEEKIR